MKRLLWLTAVLMVLAITPALAQTDSVDFRSATALGKPADKTKALEDFVARYSSSKFTPGAYLQLFSLYVDQGKEAAALGATQHYLVSIPPDGRMNAYNQFAWELAQKNMALDSALAFATRASELARSQGSGTLSSIEDTRAYVLFRHGDAAEAERVQRGAIRGHEDDPDYLGRLALYEEGNGKRREALETLARSLYHRNDPEMAGKFVEWLRKEAPDSSQRAALVQSIVMTTVHQHLDSLRGAEMVAGKSEAAAFLAATGVRLGTAEQWANEAVRSAGEAAPVEDAVTYTQNLALVLAAEGKYQEAFSRLEAIRDLVSPWATDYWLALGTTCEHLGDRRGAIDAYSQGLLVMDNAAMRARLVAAYTAEHGSAVGLDRDLEQLKQSGASFDPGHYKTQGPPTGKVVLAELFTGAECGPCVGSDVAFDALKNYFPTTSLAILEYHVHIPGPDPMTTADSWTRFQAYAGGGTPTVVIDGQEKIVGGGPRYIAHNRFNLYRYAIEREESKKSPIRITLTVADREGTISVSANVEHVSGIALPGKPMFNVALVERSVQYTGRNGISEHSLVVRKLLFGPKGTPLSLDEASSESMSAEVKSGEVKAELDKTLSDPKAQPSWPKFLRNFNGWTTPPPAMNPSNLAIVAWVQDAKTNAVVQAAYKDIAAGLGTE